MGSGIVGPCCHLLLGAGCQLAVGTLKRPNGVSADKARHRAVVVSYAHHVSRTTRLEWLEGIILFCIIVVHVVAAEIARSKLAYRDLGLDISICT